MSRRSMYIWKLAPVIAAEGGVAAVVAKAKRAKLSALWIKIAEGTSAYANVVGSVGADFAKLVQKAHAEGIEVWGWHVPHCADAATADKEAAAVKALAVEFALDGLIMDAEGGAEFFQGDKAAADAYGAAMSKVCKALGKPLAISSNDIP